MARLFPLLGIALFGCARAQVDARDAGPAPKADASNDGCALTLSLYDWRVKDTPIAVCVHRNQRVLKDLATQLRISPAARIDLKAPGAPMAQPFKFGTLDDFGSAPLVEGMTIVLERQHRLMPDLLLVGNGCRRELRSASEGFVCNGYFNPLPEKRKETQDCVSNVCDTAKVAAARAAKAPNPYDVCIGSGCSPPTVGGASLGFGMYYVEVGPDAFVVACEGAGAYHNDLWASLRSECINSVGVQK